MPRYPSGDRDDPDEMIEKGSLLCVAMSRARDELDISYAGKPSIFSSTSDKQSYVTIASKTRQGADAHLHPRMSATETRPCIETAPVPTVLSANLQAAAPPPLGVAAGPPGVRGGRRRERRARAAPNPGGRAGGSRSCIRFPT